LVRALPALIALLTFSAGCPHAPGAGRPSRPAAPRTDPGAPLPDEGVVHAPPTFDLEALYNHQAFPAYTQGLRGATTYLGAVQSPEGEQVAFALGVVRTGMLIAVIDIESYPSAARAQAWRIHGAEIDQLTETFVVERDRILNDSQYSAHFRSLVAGIPLLERD
jgi:hypothetical protein